MYYRFEPNKLPFKKDFSKNFEKQHQKTLLELGRLDALTENKTSQEIEMIKLPLYVKEATLSNRIEGTRATITDVYRDQKQRLEDLMKKRDSEEITNYVEAIKKYIDKEISEKNIKGIHRLLMKGVRGQKKDPGKYKKIQNAIADVNDDLDTARFIPASPAKTPYLMKNLISYVKSDELSLLKAGLCHYQFETIHPFRDGNGRVGRLLIIMCLVNDEIVSNPVLYLSEYFNKHRDEYIERLYEVSMKGNLEEWMMFFMKGVEKQCRSSVTLIRELDRYREEFIKEMVEETRSKALPSIVDLLFENPFITIKNVQEKTGFTPAGASGLIKKMIKKNYLEEITGRKRNKLFVARGILDILEKRR